MQPAGTLWQGSLLESVGSFSRTKSVHKIVNTLEMSLVRWDRYMSQMKGKGAHVHIDFATDRLEVRGAIKEEEEAEKEKVDSGSCLGEVTE